MEMIEANPRELTGQALEWAVALALGWKMVRVPADIDGQNAGEVLAPPDLGNDFDWPRRGAVGPCFFVPRWASDLSIGGLLAFSEKISIWWHSGDNCWRAAHPAWMDADVNSDAFDDLPESWAGPTPLIAAMRCLVEFKLGKAVQVPAILMKEPQ